MDINIHSVEKKDKRKEKEFLQSWSLIADAWNAIFNQKIFNNPLLLIYHVYVHDKSVCLVLMRDEVPADHLFWLF